jgi:hypothetical protein
MDGAQEVHRSLVIAGRDGTVLLELGEEILDQMPCLVSVVGARVLAVGLGRDHRHLAGLLQGLDHALLRIEGLVGDENARFQVRQQRIRPVQIMRLARRERKPGWVAERIDPGVDLGAQAATAAPDRLLVAAFLAAPALCWCARTIVLSIIAYSLSASPAKCWKSLAHTPRLVHQPWLIRLQSSGRP